MSNAPIQSSPYSEDWSSYRKLVVDTLKRLDDRTLDTFQRLSDLTSRVHLIENNNTFAKDLARIEADVKAVDGRVDDVEDQLLEVTKTLAEQAGSKKVFVWLVGILCSVIGFAASVGVEKFWPGGS